MHGAEKKFERFRRNSCAQSDYFLWIGHESSQIWNFKICLSLLQKSATNLIYYTGNNTYRLLPSEQVGVYFRTAGVLSKTALAEFPSDI